MALALSLRRRKGVSSDEVVESITRASTGPAVTSVPPTRGFVDGIPLGGTTPWNPGAIGGASRQEFADQLYGAYMACTPASACIDVIARTITAGGLVLSPKDEKPDQDSQPAVPPQVRQLQELFDFVNPRENMRQLLTGIITDLLVFGDAFVEVVYLGDLPVALYSLDSPSMIPLADEHGTISGYTQQLDPFRTADFEPREVMHFTLTSPRGGVYGVGAIQKALLPITAWLFAAGLLKETMRKGDPPRVHLDYPLDTPRNEIESDREKWLVKNLGIANVGNPFITKGGAKADDLKVAAVTEYLATISQKRDEILTSMGVPPRKLSIAEAGQLGGTGEGAVSDKTFRVNTCGPLAEIVLEVFNFDLAFMAYGISDWVAKFGEVDWRDDETIEDISHQRVTDGRWTINRGRKEIGEPPVDGGDDAVIIQTRDVVLVRNLAPMSDAAVEKMAGSPLAPVVPDIQGNPPEDQVSPPKPPNPSSQERSPSDEEAALTEAFNRDFQQRRKRALKELARVDG